MEQFTFVKRGYDPEEVDKYITTLEQVIKSYKDKDNAIKNAIISAQVAADNVVRNAQAQADAYKLQIADQLEDMRNTLDLNRRRLQVFDEAYTSMVGKFMRELDMSDMQALMGKIEEMEEAIADLQGLEVVSGSKDEYLEQEPGRSREYRDTMQDLGGYRDNAPVADPRAVDHRTPDSRLSMEPRLPADPRAPMDTRPSIDRPTRDTRGFDTPPRDSHRDFMREPNREMPEMGRAPHDPGRAAHESSLTTHEPRPMYDQTEADYDRDMRPAARDMRLPAFPTDDLVDMREPARDLRPQRDMMMSPAPQPTQHDQFRDSREMMRPAAQDIPPPRDSRRDPGRDGGRDIMRDAPRDVRRDPPGRDIMSPPPMRPDQMRLPERNSFAQEPDNYGNEDQNLLPPVASLM